MTSEQNLSENAPNGESAEVNWGWRIALGLWLVCFLALALLEFGRFAIEAARGLF